MQKITPFLWFDTQAEEAANFYVSIFKNAKMGRVVRYGDAGPGPKGSVMTASFSLDGAEFVALNGGKHYTMTPGTSFVVSCTTKDEVNHYWDRLAAGGTPMKCGWVTDKFGVTWQVVPTALPDMLQDKDPARARRVAQAMMKMVKLDVDMLQRAYDGE
jgi:predicted 3-demethylubiquinone-9 3-methyltransferase (glyoxalase superfamily)